MRRFVSLLPNTGAFIFSILVTAENVLCKALNTKPSRCDEWGATTTTGASFDSCANLPFTVTLFTPHQNKHKRQKNQTSRFPCLYWKKNTNLLKAILFIAALKIKILVSSVKNVRQNCVLVGHVL